MASSRTSCDLYTTYGIDKSCQLCSGMTRKGRKCGRYINPARHEKSKRIVTELGKMDPIQASRHALSHELARLLLCQRSDNQDHQSQAERIVTKWRSRVADFINEASNREHGNEARISPSSMPQAVRQRHRRAPIDGPSSGEVTTVTQQNTNLVPLPERDIDNRTLQVPRNAHAEGRNTRHSAMNTASERRPRERTVTEIDQQQQIEAQRRKIDGLEESLRRLQIGAPAPSSRGSISGICPICREDLVDRTALVSCRAQCGQYMHLNCMRRWWHTDDGRRCPLW